MKKYFFCLLSLIFSFFILSCEVGLGAAVDTESPKGKILIPGESFIVREKFLFTGTYRDDGPIESIKIKLVPLSVQTDSKDFNANFEVTKTKTQDGRWWCVIDPLDENNLIVDGEYNSVVTILDKMGHKTEYTRQFKIDNTPPVIVLSKPSSKPDSVTLSSYGQTLTLSGVGADDNNIDHIEMKFYTDTDKSNLLDTIVLKNVPTSIDMDFATFSSTDQNDYYKIYGSLSKNGAKKVFCTLTAYDSAQKYSESLENSIQSEDDKKGNATDLFYFHTDVYDSILKFYKITDVYQMMTGNYVPPANSAKTKEQIINEVKAELARTKNTMNAFSVNPENSPYFTIGSLNTLTKNGNDFADESKGFYIQNNSMIVDLSVIRGLDQIPFVLGENFAAYVIECDAFGNPLAAAEKIILKSKYGEDDFGNPVYETGGRIGHKTITGAYTFSIPLNKTENPELVYGKNYVFGVNGKDKSGNSIVNNGKGYGFKFVASKTTPRLTLTNPAPGTVYKKLSEPLVLKGKVISDGGFPTIKVFVNSTENAVIPLISPIEGQENEFEYTLPASVFSQTESKIYNISVKAENDYGFVQAERTLIYDLDAPEITVSSVIPVVTRNGKNNNINGIITVKGNINDAFDKVSEASYSVSQGGVEKFSGVISNGIINFTVDTTTLDNASNAQIKITAYDSARNVKSWEKTYYVDQSTDTPVVEFTDKIHFTVNYPVPNPSDNWAFNKYPKMGTMSFVADDDDGIKTISVQLFKNSIPVESAVEFDSPIVSYTMPPDTGIYKVIVIVKDVVYSVPANTNNIKTYEFYTRVTSSVPEYTIISDKEWVSTTSGSASYQLTFKVKDGTSAPYRIEQKKPGESNFTEVGTSATLISATETIDDQIYLNIKYPLALTSSDTSGKIIYQLKDSFGIHATSSFDVKIDNTLPVVTITPHDLYFNSSSFEISGNAQDINLSKLQAWLLNAAIATVNDVTDTHKSAGIAIGSIPVDSHGDYNNKIYDITDGKYKLYLEASDFAGNTAKVLGNKFTVDTIIPASTFKSDTANVIYDSAFTKLNGTPVLTAGSVYYAKGGFTLTGVISEDNFKSAKLKVNGIDTPFTNGGNAAGEWKYLQNDNEKEYVYELLLEDDAKNKSSSKITVFVDTAAPAVEINAPSENEAYGTSSVTIKGSHEDAISGTKSITYTLFDKNNTPVSTHTNIAVPFTSSTWSKSITLPTEEGFYSIKVTATDKLNHEFVTGARNFSYDTEIPILRETGIGAGALFKNAGFAFSGTASDDKNGLYNGGVGAIKISALKEGENTPRDYSANVSGAKSGSWSFGFVVGISNSSAVNYLADGVYTFVITVTDLAGRTSSVTRYVTIDTVNPVFTTKDVSTSGIIYNSATWYSTRQILLEAAATEIGTGLSSVSVSTDGSTYMAMTKTAGTDSSGNNLYISSITLPNDGSNTLYFKAADLAGNEISDTRTVLADTTPPAVNELVSVDGTPAANLTGTKLVNKSRNIGVVVRAADRGTLITDPDTGVKSVKITKIGTTPKDISGTLSAGNYNITIPIADLTNGGVIVTVTDNANNSKDLELFTLQVDDVEPVVSLNSHSSGSVVNKIITLGGIVSDNNQIDSIAVYYKKSPASTESAPSGESPSDWTAFSTPSLSAPSWSLSIDTESLAVPAGNYLYVSARAIDKAGNITYSVPVKLTVDQNSDRPIVTIQGISLENSGSAMAPSNRVWITNKTIFINVQDDDGLAASNPVSYSTDNISWTPVAISNGSGSFTISSNDGNVDLRLKVKDSANGDFFSKTVSAQDAIYLKDASRTFGDTLLPSTEFYMTIDTESPRLEVKGVSDSAGGTYSTVYTDLYYGGSIPKFYIKVNASDPNGIQSVKASYSGLLTGEKVGTYSGSNYIISDIPCNIGSGTLNVTVTATDKAGRESIEKFSLLIDNTNPVIEFYSPSTTSYLSGSITARGIVDENSKVYYSVTPINVSPDSMSPSTAFTYTPESGSPVSLPANDFAGNPITPPAGSLNSVSAYTEITDANLSWKILFDGNMSSPTDTHSVLMNEWLTKYAITTPSDISANKFDKIVKMYLWIKAVDSAGNKAEKSIELLIDPQGTRPSVSVSYPAEAAAGNEEKLGGSVRLVGTATDDKGAKFVWIQIDTNGDNIWDTTDYNKLKNKYNFGDMTNNSDTVNADVSKNGIKIIVQGSSWNETINKDGELNPDDDSVKVITLWVYATDEEKNLSKKVERKFKLDKDTPVIVQDTLRLVQYNSAFDSLGDIKDAWEEIVSGSTTTIKIKDMYISASQPYFQDMNITGRWYLVGKVTDASGIQKISYDNTTKISSSGQSYINNSLKQEYFVPDSQSNYYFSVPVGEAITDSVGSTHRKIEATENTSHNLFVSKDFYVTYDNKAPECLMDESNTHYRLPRVDAAIVNSDGYYTFGSLATENPVSGINQSGVKQVAFYFTRDKGSISKIFDVMIKSGANGNEISNYKTGGTALKSEDGLYWKEINLTNVSGSALTLSGTSPNIHVGGLAKVNGVIYRINNVSGNTVTLSNEPGTATKALFAIANVVDNSYVESVPGNPVSAYNSSTGYGYGYYSNYTDDDGDYMLESLVKRGTAWTWEASINSSNISDGEVTLHYVVFDSAGNFVKKDIKCFVANNQPRIAGMKIGCDVDGNDTVENSEFISKFSTQYAGGYDGKKKITSITFPEILASSPQPVLSVRGKLIIKPEIVGGNGELKYNYKVSKRNSSNTDWDASYYTNDTLKPLGMGNGSEQSAVVTLTNNIEFNVIDFLTVDSNGKEIEDADNQKFTFKIWDSTEGSTMGDSSSGSQNAELNVILDVKIRDSIPAKNYIIPFYWEKRDKNSLFKENSNNGHIELPADLPDANFSDSSDLYDKQPKVSGKIKIEGVACDNNLLKELKAKIEGFNSDNEFTFASYSGGSWTTASSLSGNDIPLSGWAAEITKATYADLVKAKIISSLPAGTDGANTVDYNTRDYGHVVKWKLYFDTSKVTDSVGTDKSLTVSALDRGKPAKSGLTVNYTSNNFSNNGVSLITQTGGNDGSGDWSCKYTMDIVPYVRGIKSALSSLSRKSDTSEYDRTSLGRYPVDSNQSIFIYGFNIADGALYGLNNSGIEINTPLGAADSTTYEGFTVYPVSVANFVSGGIKIGKNSVYSLNNMNNNDAKGSYSNSSSTIMSQTGDYEVYKNYYNKLPNNTNNNLLTDDTYIDVWEINPVAAKSITGLILNPVMKIDPVTGMIGFAFTNGPLYFSMPGYLPAAQTNNNPEGIFSYIYWQGSFDFMTSGYFTYDSKGKTYGCVAGGDINATSADKFSFMTDRWGRSGDATGGSYGGTNANRIEIIGQDGTKAGAGNLNFDKNRIKSPVIVTNRTTDNDTDIYMAYFDNLNEEIRIRYGQLSDSSTSKMDFGMFIDSYVGGAIRHVYNLAQGKYTTQRCQIIADDSGVSPISLGYAGEYVSIDIVNGKLVLVWYDGYNNNLMYTYNENPTNIDTTAGANKTGWADAKIIFSGAGEYCQIAADKSNGIHIAAYDGITGDVKYAYLSSYDAAYTEETDSVLIDSNGIVGMNLTLDVALNDNSKAVPHISYYANGRPKIAYKADTDNIKVAGASNDMYTGKWEISYIPTKSKMAQDRINVGLWKDADTGKIKNSSDQISSAGQYYGKCYGNGTKNPVVGYAVKASSTIGYIETAQKK